MEIPVALVIVLCFCTSIAQLQLDTYSFFVQAIPEVERVPAAGLPRDVHRGGGGQRGRDVRPDQNLTGMREAFFSPEIPFSCKMSSCCTFFLAESTTRLSANYSGTDSV